jgi:exonuclease SbcC
MNINSVEIRNFYSFRNTKIQLDKYKDGIVVIDGYNQDTKGSNGSGKSAVIEAIVWGLFGRTIRKSTEEAFVNNTAKKKCVVKITVNDDIVIERGKRPVFLKVYKSGEEITADNALNTQKLIESLLQTNYKVFLASTVFGQQNNIEFINATPDDKRIIIKNFLNLDHIFKMRDSVKLLKSEYSQGVKKNDAIIAEHEKTIKSFDKELEELSSLQKEIESSDYANALDYSPKDILDLEAKVREKEDEIRKERNLLSNLDLKLKDLQSLLAYYANNPSPKCSECNQPVPSGFNTQELSSKKKKVLSEIRKKEGRVTSLEGEVPEIPISSRHYDKVYKYQTLKKESETYEDLKKFTLEKIQAAHTEKQDFNSKYEIMRFWEKAFSESGLVKYIIRNVLSYFNDRVNFYLAHLAQGKFFIEFDEELSEKITHKKKIIHYISLSGGEKKKISLAVMLGLQDLLLISHNQNSNLMFFDEVAENLDQDGLDGLYILLSELKKNKCLFVITHNNYLKSLLDNAKTLSIIKTNGISKVNSK